MEDLGLIAALCVSTTLLLWAIIYIIREWSRYARMKVRAYESFVYAEHLAKHFRVSADTIGYITEKEVDPVLGNDYATLDKALDLFSAICHANNIADPYAERERIEEEDEYEEE